MGMVAISVAFASFVLSFKSTQNYTAIDGPYFEGKFAEGSGSFDGSIKVVTWNLSFGNNPDLAIDTLRTAEPLQNADILLLQEMDEGGIDRIARQLGYNYIYYPATVHSRHGKNFGNAILSKWPIVRHNKFILPNNREQARIAVLAEVKIGDELFTVVNVHLETIWMLKWRGTKQADFMIQQLHENVGDHLIIGGDFNTWSNASIKYLEKLFEKYNLIRASSGSGYTFQYYGIQLMLDHIWLHDSHESTTGVWRETDASDHFPLWIDIKLGDTK